MPRYLYGASIQGIQDFIMKTNKLKEVVGASEIVKEICESKFFEVAGLDNLDDDKNRILTAAGNIKYLFDDETEDKLETVVRYFPKTVMEYAPGITISQAVVQFEENEIAEALMELERRLKIQRNQPSVPLETGYMALNRARRTGGIAYENKEIKKGVFEDLDEATSKKRDASEKNTLFDDLAGKGKYDPDFLSNEITDISSGQDGQWIAVIHADGNGLGNLIQSIGNKLVSDGKFAKFSQKIDESTKTALQNTYSKIIKEPETKPEEDNRKYRYPIRPVIIGGDDVTLIIRADLALEFTRIFLHEFEEVTKDNFKNFGYQELAQGLSACAGIAYVKSSYPLHYALHLAEALTKDAKKLVKLDGMPKIHSKPDIPHSSLAFFKVQDSFIEDLKEMKKRTKFAKVSSIDYDYGPYLLRENLGGVAEAYPTIKELTTTVEAIQKNSSDKSKGVSKLRQLVTESFKNKATMDFMVERMKTVNTDFVKEIDLVQCINGKQKTFNDEFVEKIKLDQSLNDKQIKSILLDAIQIHSFNPSNATSDEKN